MGKSSFRNRAGDNVVDFDDIAIDGVTITATPAELNVLDGVTVTVDELNALDGAPIGTPSIVVGSQNVNDINVVIQLKDGTGADLAVRGSVYAYLSDDENGDSIAATAPSGGVAIGTDGVIDPITAGKSFMLTSEADGDIDITITEAGADTWYLIIRLPTGKLVASGEIAFT